MVPQAEVDPPGVVGPDGALHHGHQVVDAVVTDLLHETEDAGPEKDLGVAVLELVTDQVDLFHDGVGGGNVLLLLSDWTLDLLHGSHSLLGCKDGVTGPEVIVDDPVGVALTTNPDAFHHTVAGELVHHKEGVNDARLFVVVGHNATDERGLGGHQHVHQVVKLILEVGAHRLEVGHLGSSLGLDHHSLLSPSVAGDGQIFLLLGLAWVVGVDLIE